jgi:TorA maturation chaperone TorD
MSDTEDHFAYLCEVMRYLIAGEDVAVANLTRQREFFSTHIQPWATLMCDDIQSNSKANFYASLAEFIRAFMGIEAQGFDMLV